MFFNQCNICHQKIEIKQDITVFCGCGGTFLKLDEPIVRFVGIPDTTKPHHSMHSSHVRYTSALSRSFPEWQKTHPDQFVQDSTTDLGTNHYTAESVSLNIRALIFSPIKKALLTPLGKSYPVVSKPIQEIQYSENDLRLFFSCLQEFVKQPATASSKNRFPILSRQSVFRQLHLWICAYHRSIGNARVASATSIESINPVEIHHDIISTFFSEAVAFLLPLENYFSRFFISYTGVATQNPTQTLELLPLGIDIFLSEMNPTYAKLITKVLSTPGAQSKKFKIILSDFRNLLLFEAFCESAIAASSRSVFNYKIYADRLHAQIDKIAQ